MSLDLERAVCVARPRYRARAHRDRMIRNGAAALDAQLRAGELGAAYRDGRIGAGGGAAERREHGGRDHERAAKIHVPSFVRGGPPRMRRGWLGFHSTLVV